MAGVISPVTGTRVEPIDGYIFVRGTTNTFKMIFTNNGIPVTMDSGSQPVAKILNPKHLSGGNTPVPEVLATITGDLTVGQQFEYSFSWDVPADLSPSDEYVVSYEGLFGLVNHNFGDEFFTVSHGAGQIGIKIPAYATASDVRAKKFNIDDYLPKALDNNSQSLTSRNDLIEKHLRDATTKLREELNLSKSRGNSENYRLFCVYYTVWSILLASRGEDGSSVSSENLSTWKSEWLNILAQEKRESVLQGVPIGRG